MTGKTDDNILDQPESFELLFQDDALLVLNKPAGLLSVPGRGEDKQDSLASRVQIAFPQALTVHRLDMSTSGLMLMALGLSNQRYIQRLFEQREVKKKYIAVVAGRLDPEYGEVDLPIMRDWPNRPRQKVDHEHGKPSLTRYQLLQYNADEDTSRVELQPVTGRSHQLRVHMQALGHPILGDTLYGSGYRSRDTSARLERLLLHAESICFRHPNSGDEVCFHSFVPF